MSEPTHEEQVAAVKVEIYRRKLEGAALSFHSAIPPEETRHITVLRAVLVRLEADRILLKFIEKALSEDTNAEEHPCCGWGPLLVRVRDALSAPPSDTPSQDAAGDGR